MLSKIVDWFKPFPDAPRITDEQLVKKMYRSWRIRMFFGMYFGYIFFYFCRKNISFVAPALMDDGGLTAIQYGALGSTLYVTYGIGKFVSGMLADKCNIRRFMATGLLGSAIVSLFFPFLPSFYLMAFFWGLNGVFQSAGFPPVAKGLVYWFAPKERATKWTLWSSSHTVGTAGVGVLAWACLKFGTWHMVFYVPGIIGLLFSLSMFKILGDKPAALGLPPIEEYMNDVLPVEKEKGLGTWAVLKKYVFANPYLWFLAIAYIFVYFIRFATLDWSAKFMVDRGISEATSAGLLTIMPLIGTLGGISAGWMADHFFKGRCTPINIIFLTLLIFSLWGAYVFTGHGSYWLTAVFLALVGFFVDGPQNLVGGVQTSRITVQESVSAACGFTGMFGYLGAFLSGIGGGWILQNWGWYGIYMTCGVCCVIAMFFVGLTWRKEAAGRNSK